MFNENNDVIWKISRILLNEGYEVYINKTNSYNLPVFHSSGTANSVPDIIALNTSYNDLLFNNSSENNFQKQPNISLAIETKKGDKLHEVYKGCSQLINYFMYWITGQAKFYINGKELKYIGTYLLGTGYSSQGYLYHGDEELPPLNMKFISDIYDIKIYPYTHSIYSNLRNNLKNKLGEIRESFVRKKFNVDIGVLFRKIPKFGGQLSNEFWSWYGGSKMKPLSTLEKRSTIKVKLVIVDIHNSEVLLRNGAGNAKWLSRFDICSEISKQDIGRIKELEVSLYFYNKEKIFFGLG